MGQDLNRGPNPIATAAGLDLPQPGCDLPPVFVRLGHILLILALLAATGGHWTVLQTVAWTNMLANNLRTDPIAAALTKTFNGKNPCTMCKQISAGKKSEQKTEFPTLLKKLEFYSKRPVIVFSAPTDFHLVVLPFDALPNWSEAPPKPRPKPLPPFCLA
jgi:hypothetical protein